MKLMKTVTLYCIA